MAPSSVETDGSPSVPAIPTSALFQLPGTDFMDADDLGKIKDYTAFLAHLDIFKNRDRGKQLTVTSDPAKKLMRDQFNKTSNIVNLSVRNHEVLAIGVSATPEHKPNEQTTIVKHNALVFCINPGSDTHINRQSAEPFKIFLQPDIKSEVNLPSDKDIVDFLVSRYEELRKRNPKETDIAFPEHMGYLKHLLQKCHDSTTEKDLEKAFERLETYIFAVSHCKMTRRLELGQVGKNRNFYEYMTTSVPQMEEKLKVNDIPELNLLSNPPTAQQLQLIEQFAEETKEAQWSENAANRPVYDDFGRRRFHTMLWGYLRDVNQALRALRGKMNWQQQRDDDKALKMMTKTSEIKELVKNAVLNVTALHGFLCAFGDGEQSLLDHHLNWLWTVYGRPSRNERKRKREEENIEAYNSLPGSDAMEDIKLDPKKEIKPDPKKEIKPDPKKEIKPDPKKDNINLPEASGSKKIENTIDDDTVMEDVDEEDRQDDEDEGDELDVVCREMADMSEGDIEWPKAAKKYLGLICLHVHALDCEKPRGLYQKRTSAEQRKAAWIKESKIVVVDVQRGQLDQKRRSIASCIDDFIGTDEDDVLKKDDLLKALSYKQEQGKGELVKDERIVHDERFKGSLHCEAVILALFTLSKYLSDVPVSGQKIETAWLNRDGSFAAKADLVDMLRQLLPFIAVSKRCCPLCSAVVERIAEAGILTGSPELVVAGNHRAWTAAAIPPFLPKEIAAACLKHVKKKVSDQLYEKQVECNQKREKEKEDKEDEMTRKDREESHSGSSGELGPSSSPAPPRKRVKVSTSSDAAAAA